MAVVNRHIIQKQIFELIFRNTKDAALIQQEVSSLCTERVLPALDEFFSRIIDAEEVLQIDRLSIDLGTISPERIAAELPEKLLVAITEQLEKLQDNEEPERKSVKNNQFEAWLHYLKKGFLPWHVQRQKEETLQRTVLEKLSTSGQAIQQFKKLLKDRPVALQRLVKQHQEDFLVSLIQASFGKQPLKLSELRYKLEVAFLALPISILQKLFGREKMNKRDTFITFWQQVFHLSFQQDSSVTEKRLLLGVLKKLRGRSSGSTTVFQNIEQKIQVAQFPLPALEVSLSQLVNQAPAKPEQSPSLVRKRKASEEESIQDKRAIDKPPGEEKPGILSASNLETPPPEGDPSIGIDRGYLGKNSSIDDPTATGQVTEETILPWRELPERTQFYVDNAGLIILHPFLNTYFDTLGLLEEEQFKDKKRQERAVHLLQYLSSGKSQLPEYDHLLAKFLCDLPLDYPLDRQIDLNPIEKEEGEKLLQAIIKHWGALGNVKPDSLREGFLQREGKLEKSQNGWLLLVERQTIDILLGQLPWGIGMIKLPWMPELLNVEWR